MGRNFQAWSHSKQDTVDAMNYALLSGRVKNKTPYCRDVFTNLKNTRGFFNGKAIY